MRLTRIIAGIILALTLVYLPCRASLGDYDPKTAMELAVYTGGADPNGGNSILCPTIPSPIVPNPCSSPDTNGTDLGPAPTSGATPGTNSGPTGLGNPALYQIAVSIVIFIAASLSSTVGFAFSAIAAAMIFHFVSDTVEAVQIMMVASIAIQAYCVAAMWRTISLRSCAPFLIGGVATIPLGIYLLLAFHPQAYIFTMGLALALYGAYMLFRQPPSTKRGGIFLDVAVGALGGITGPLAAFPGAFVTIWCGMRGWDKLVQRSVYQPYILIMQVLTLAVLSVVTGRNIFNQDVIAYALPGIAGAYLGLQVFQKLSNVQFQRLVNLALIVSGIALALE